MTRGRRRQWRTRAGAGLVIPIVLVLLGACAAAARFPVTVTHRFGDTEVVRTPQRIVALAPGDRDDLLALDIVPIGMPGVDGNHAPLPAWTARRLAEVRQRTGVTAAPAEAYTQPSAPDVLPTTGPVPDLLLAVTGHMGAQDYDDDSAIAPVVGPPPGYGAESPAPVVYGEDRAPWQDATRLIGQAVGKPVEADQLVAGIEAQFAVARARHPRLAGRTALCAHLGPSSAPQIFVVPAGPRTPCSRFLAELGLRGVPTLDTRSGRRALAVSTAQIAAAGPDLIVLDDTADDGGASQDVVRVNLPPGQRSVGIRHPETDIVSAPNALNLPQAVDAVATTLERAVP